MANRQHIPTSLYASGNVRFRNDKFDGTKLPMVVGTSLDPNLDTNPVIVAMARRQIDEVLADRKRTC
jgi:hypothetical protein